MRQYCFLSVMLLLAANLAAAAPVPVENGDFEKGLEGWSLLKPDGFAHGEMRVETADVHAGKQSVRITNPAGQGKALVGMLRPIKLPDEARTFRITAWMKADVLPEVVELRIAATGKDGQALVPWEQHGWRFLRPPVEPHRGQWHRLKVEFGAMPDWGGFQLTSWINGPGADVIIDDIQVETIDPNELQIQSVGGRLAGAVPLWWESPQVKVYPNQPPPTRTDTAISLAAAGGEYECVQVCLRPERELADVTVACQVQGAGPKLSANFVGLINVQAALTGATVIGPTPDPLLTDEKHTLPAGQTSVVWLTLQVPPGTKPGDYAGSVALKAAGVDCTVPLRIHVYGFDLPTQPFLRTIARIWQSHPGYEAEFRRNLQEHRCAGSGQLGGITTKAIEGQNDVAVDTSKLKEAADTNFRPYNFSVYNIPSVYIGDWSGPYNKENKWLGFELFSPAFDQAFESYCRKVGDALRAEGLMQYGIWQIWDEPHDEWVEKCKQLARLVRKGAPDGRIYLTTGVKEDMLDLVDIWCLPWPSEYRGDRAAEVRKRGGELWAYENDLYALDRPDSSLRLRYYPWRLRKYDITGVEWWAISQWKSDPWTVANQYAPQNGGGFFLYPTPDKKGAPVNSIRWELYREGVEDYDLLTMLGREQDRVLQALRVTDARLSGVAQRQELVDRVAIDNAEVVRDPAAGDKARREACERTEFAKALPLAVVARVETAKGPAVVVQVERGAAVSVNGKAYAGGKAEVAVKAGQPVTVTVKSGGKSKSVTLR